jgi:KDO2-lipid IV(A) lauroyltransferase
VTDRLEFILFSFFGFVIRLLPLRLVQSTGRFLGSIGYLVAQRRRAIAIDNLSHAFPNKTRGEIKRIALGAFQNYAICISEFLWFPRLTPERLRKLVRMINVDLAAEVHSRGKGVVFVSGHFGNWELSALALAHFTGYPMTIIVQNQRNRLVNEVINKYRCIWGNSVVPMESSAREILKKLSEGQAVGILADQSAPMEGIYVDFFGRPAATHDGPAIFSLRIGAPLVIGFLVRQAKGRYEIRYEEIPATDLHDYSEENVVELTRRHVAVLERYVRQYPDQWLWMHRRWKHSDKAPKAKTEADTAVVSPRARNAEVVSHP